MQVCPKCASSLADDVVRCDCGQILDDTVDVSMLRGLDKYYALKVIAKIYRVAAWLTVAAGVVRCVLVFNSSTVQTPASETVGELAVVVLTHGFVFLTCLAIAQGIRLALDMREDLSAVLEKLPAK